MICISFITYNIDNMENVDNVNNMDNMAICLNNSTIIVTIALSLDDRSIIAWMLSSKKKYYLIRGHNIWTISAFGTYSSIAVRILPNRRVRMTTNRNGHITYNDTEYNGIIVLGSESYVSVTPRVKYDSTYYFGYTIVGDDLHRYLSKSIDDEQIDLLEVRKIIDDALTKPGAKCVHYPGEDRDSDDD
jgi:hypothetical protein